MLYGELPSVTLPNGEATKGIKITVPNPPKIAFLGLPTNEMLVERLGLQKTIRRTLRGRKTSSESVSNAKADLALFEKLRLDKDGVVFDEYEASNAVQKLIFLEVTGCDRDGDQYTVSLDTRFGTTRHVVTVPFQKDIQQYRRSVVSAVDLPHGAEELRFRIDPPVQLYDSVIQKIEGYAEGWTPKEVPPHHKSAVVVELVQAIEELDPAMDPNF